MAKVIRLNTTSIGGDIENVDIYHTTITGSNLISASVSSSLLTGSGITFVVEDNVNTFWAYVSGGLCAETTSSITASTYSPNTRYFTVYTSGSDEGGSVEMIYPSTIAATTSSFTSSVNFIDFAYATIQANEVTYPNDQFQGWYYSNDRASAFSVSPTLTLTNSTFTGSDVIYAYFKDEAAEGEEGGGAASATITSLAFSDSTITNASQTINFVVAGTVNGQYTLTGATGATAPSGTHTIPAGGTNTHSITISANGTGESARSPRVTVATVSSTTTTTFSPVSLQVYDTVSQAEGPAAAAPTYYHTLNYSVAGGSIHTGTSYFNTANPTPVTSNAYPLTAGATWYSHYVYFLPPNGQEFTSANDVSISLPSWAVAGTPYLGTSTTDYFSYIRVQISWTGQSSIQTGTLSATCSTSTVTTTAPNGSKMSINHSDFGGSFTPSSWLSGTLLTGLTSTTVTQNLTVTDGYPDNPSAVVTSITSANGSSTFGDDLVSPNSISGLPASVGDVVTIVSNITAPAAQRLSRVITSTGHALVYAAHD